MALVYLKENCTHSVDVPNTVTVKSTNAGPQSNPGFARCDLLDFAPLKSRQFLMLVLIVQLAATTGYS